MPSRVFLRVLDRATARPTGLARLLLVGALAGAILLSSTVPAGAAERSADRRAGSALGASLVAFLEAMDELGAALAGGDPGADTDGPNPNVQVPAVSDKDKKKGKQRCRDAGKGAVPHVVAAIFRCRLQQAGFSEQEIGQWTAEAVVVSKCESYWDPNIVVFNGKYLDSPHPRTGYRYSAAGVFQFIRKTADKWIEGGYAQVKDPRANIDAAARLFIHNRKSGLRGWEDWACAAANDGFKAASVLPNYPGGPSALPDWAWQY